MHAGARSRATGRNPVLVTRPHAEVALRCGGLHTQPRVRVPGHVAAMVRPRFRAPGITRRDESRTGEILTCFSKHLARVHDPEWIERALYSAHQLQLERRFVAEDLLPL